MARKGVQSLSGYRPEGEVEQLVGVTVSRPKLPSTKFQDTVSYLALADLALRPNAPVPKLRSIYEIPDD